MGLKFRGLLIEDSSWITEFLNDAEAVKYWGVFPLTEHEIREFVKKRLEDAQENTIVAEQNGKPAGWVSVDLEAGRCRHVAEFGIFVGRKYWGRGIGTALTKKAIELAKQLGCRKLELGTTEGNVRAISLYKKVGFEIEAFKDEYEYVDGAWKKEYFMGLELAPCEPKIGQSMLKLSCKLFESTEPTQQRIDVRQLMDHDLDEMYRLQNCPESTKSTDKVPPITREEIKRWYEQFTSREGRHCFACYEGSVLLGYLKFRAGSLPSPSMNCDEIVVDVNRRPLEAADALVSAAKGFRDRYGFRRIFAFIPQTSMEITKAFENRGFARKGTLKNHYFIDGNYVDVTLYGFS